MNQIERIKLTQPDLLLGDYNEEVAEKVFLVGFNITVADLYLFSRLYD